MKHKVHGKTPAVAAGLADKALTMADLIGLVDAREERALADRRRAALIASDPLAKVSY